jgi:hypothetical protein
MPIMQDDSLLALTVMGRAFDDEEIGALTWDVWMAKNVPRRLSSTSKPPDACPARGKTKY